MIWSKLNWFRFDWLKPQWLKPRWPKPVWLKLVWPKPELVRRYLPSLTVGNFFLICLLFQIYLISQLPSLYPLLKSLFFLEMLFLIVSAGLTFSRNRALLLAFLLIIALRIPFYLKGDGLIFHSDNALEALQPLEIQDSHRAPFFLLNSSGHNGTLKYLFVAFIWDIFGKSYITFVLFQLLIFLVFVYLFYEIFRRFIDEKIVRLFLFVHFAFIEVFFDYSLFLRAAPYLEMLTLFLLGLYLFDFSFADKKKLILAIYFLIFSSYLHPLIIFLIVPFIVTSFLYAVAAKQFIIYFFNLIGGTLLATYHLIYYKFFWPPPPPSGDWYRIIFISPSQLAFSRIPHYLKNLIRDLWICFHNLFDYEFLYSLDFFQDSGPGVTLLKVLSRTALFLSLGVCLAALGLSLIHLGRYLKRYLSYNLSRSDHSLKNIFFKNLFLQLPLLAWPYPFIFLAFLVFVGKAFILSPKPFYEPRHNIDLALWIGIGFVFFLGSLEPWKKWRLLRVLSALFLLVLACPHAFYFLKIAEFKKRSYRQIVQVLRENQVHYLATDFSLAYPIYFITDRQIKVTDSIGPVSVPFFYYWLREEMEAVPWERKAYLFFGDRFRRRPWHVKMTNEIRQRIIRQLRRENIKFRSFDLGYYVIIIPEKAVNPPAFERKFPKAGKNL